MKIICNESEKRFVINVLSESQVCFGTKECQGNCKECVEDYIDWEIEDGDRE